MKIKIYCLGAFRYLKQNKTAFCVDLKCCLQIIQSETILSSDFSEKLSLKMVEPEIQDGWWSSCSWYWGSWWWSYTRWGWWSLCFWYWGWIWWSRSCTTWRTSSSSKSREGDKCSSDVDGGKNKTWCFWIYFSRYNYSFNCEWIYVIRICGWVFIYISLVVTWLQV